MNIPFVGQAYNLKATQLDAQSCINLYLVNDSTGKNPVALYPDPGLVLWADLSGSSIRLLFALNGIAYGICDSRFYSIDGNGSEKLLGTLLTSVGRCIVIPNDYQLLILDGVATYVYQIKNNGTVTNEIYSQAAGTFTTNQNTYTSISPITFSGAGYNDLKTSGTFTGVGNFSYKVEIDGVGTPNTFKWSNNGGTTWNNSTVSITGIEQDLNYGIKIKFNNTTGHNLGATWTFEAEGEGVLYVPQIATYLDTYGILPKPGTNVFFLTESDDFTVIKSLMYAEAETYPDDIVAVAVTRQELWLIGNQTAETWYNTGAADFPLQRREGMLLNYGCIAPYTVCNISNNYLIWLAGNRDGARCIVAVEGYTATRISTEALDEELLSYSKVDDAYAYSFEWKGHVFVYFNFPTQNKTWVWDLTTKSWHQRQSVYDNTLHTGKTSDEIMGMFRGSCYMNFNGKHLVGDAFNGKIYELSDSSYMEDGKYFPCERTCQHFSHPEFQRIFCYLLEIDIEAAEGLTTGQGNEPQFMLQISRDGGKTWGREVWISGGKVGQYQKRARWKRLGISSKSFTFRLRITDPIFRVIMGAKADISVGRI
jgi:hypothetical protein